MRERIRRSLVRIGAMAAKETQHVVRDPRTLYMSLAMPVLLLFLFGYGLAFELDHIPLAVDDRDRTQASRELVRALTASNELEVVARTNAAGAIALFRKGEALGAGGARDVVVEAAEASLEDVFLAVVGRGAKEEASR